MKVCLVLGWRSYLLEGLDRLDLLDFLLLVFEGGGGLFSV